MALQEEGWPLGLRPVNERVALVRNGEFNGSLSSTTLLTASSPPSSTTDDSSSDLDTQSTGSFFHDKSITLGSLIGVSSDNVSELSRRSSRTRRRRRRADQTFNDQKMNNKPNCLFWLCSKLSSSDAVNTNAASLSHFLQEERRAAANNVNRTGGVSDFCPLNSVSIEADGNGYGLPFLFSCFCPQLTH
ncbi:uncharacterized protein At3g17950-like isoform X2 [Mercurialis annua]|uniref:uncharacterized protein At3g17950-like isoform X2 n=1 Tax=Mercurialis annua TaxID=3986 RepID=UPI00215F23FD|nr:uncharacterized protein At3g17950-like isoform X2 [Mercurialis annua]XP_050213111.1 uncharacterized protein At3g17950-like isoform X2 [Mercurialis annua]XP_050213112.1 uncharacterized protein At3g17950-like isoform X2 [Mercurialis annua]